MDIAGVWEVWLWRAVLITEKLSDFSDTVGSVVEEEKSVVVWRSVMLVKNLRQRGMRHTLYTTLLAVHDDWLEELIRLALSVPLLNGLDGVA